MRRLLLLVFCVCLVFLVYSILRYIYVAWYTPAHHLIRLDRDWLSSLQAINDTLTYDTRPSLQRIPKIIHQMWKTKSIPEGWQEPFDSCRKWNPDFQFILWTDEELESLLREHYDWFMNTYESYPYGIERVDAVRYFILYHFGGIYMDLDIGCKRSLLPLITPSHLGFMVPETSPVGYSNDFLVSRPGHPFARLLMENLSKWNHFYLTNYATVFLSTGPAFVSYHVGIYSAIQQELVFTDEKAGLGRVGVLESDLYGGSASDTFFAHYPGNSWHGEDAAYLLWIFDHLLKIIKVAFILLFIVILIYICLIQLKKRRIKSLNHVA